MRSRTLTLSLAALAMLALVPAASAQDAGREAATQPAATASSDAQPGGNAAARRVLVAQTEAKAQASKRAHARGMFRYEAWSQKQHAAGSRSRAAAGGSQATAARSKLAVRGAAKPGARSAATHVIRSGGAMPATTPVSGRAAPGRGTSTGTIAPRPTTPAAPASSPRR